MAFQYAQHKFPAFWAEQASPSYFPILSSARLDLVVHCAWEREKSILMNKVRILKKNYIDFSKGLVDDKKRQMTEDEIIKFLKAFKMTKH